MSSFGTKKGTQKRPPEWPQTQAGSGRAGCSGTQDLTEGLFSPISPSSLKIKLQRIRYLEAEIADMQKEIDRQKEKAVAANERLERLMKEMGITDLPKTENDNQC